MKIANDTPKVIIEYLYKVDVSKISKQQIDNWYRQGSQLILNYPKNIRDLSSVIMMDINLPGVPQEIGNLLSKINYSSLNIAQKFAAENLMKKWIKNNLPMRK